MRSFLAIFFTSTVLLQSAFATEELNPTTLKQYLDSGKNGMIKFYQTWCGHCTRMKPDWDKLAEEAHPSVFIKDVNCGDEADLCQENGVQGYPTIKVYNGGEEEPYNGERSFEAMLDFVDSNLAMKCDVNAPTDCSKKAQKYIKKWQDKGTEAIQKEVVRLDTMKASSMTLELKQWLKERLQLLNQLAPADKPETDEEL